MTEDALRVTQHPGVGSRRRYGGNCLLVVCYGKRKSSLKHDMCSGNPPPVGVRPLDRFVRQESTLGSRVSAPFDLTYAIINRGRQSWPVGSGESGPTSSMPCKLLLSSVEIAIYVIEKPLVFYFLHRIIFINPRACVMNLSSPGITVFRGDLSLPISNWFIA
jgi:hypothetical protein